MAKYTVKESFTPNGANEAVEVGSVIELSDADAAEVAGKVELVVEDGAGTNTAGAVAGENTTQ